MNQNIGTIELVTFKTKGGIPRLKAQKALESLNDCVKNYEGFIGRKLSFNESGEWLDLVYWTNREAADKASEQIMNNPAAQEAFSIINEATMKMYHYDVQSQFISSN